MIRSTLAASLCASVLLAAGASPPPDRAVAPPAPAADTMKAVQLSGFGGPEMLRLTAIPKPAPGKGEVLVQVMAAGVNPVDWKIREGLLKGRGPQPPITLGCDLSGVVVAIGEGVVGHEPGEAVFTFLSPLRTGSFAQYAVVPESSLADKPDSVDHLTAAAMPVAALTAWQALFEHGQLKEGQTVLVHGAAGGVGHFAVQMAHNAGARVIATASRENAEFVKTLGADVVIDYKAQRFEEVAKEVDLVLDAIGGETQERSIATLRKGGILVSIVQPPDEAKLAAAGVKGLVFMVRPDAGQLARIAEDVDRGRLKVHVSGTYPLAEFARALERSKAGHVKGKLVLKVE